MIEKVGIEVRYNGFTYTIGEGFRNMFKNTKSTVGSIITMVCTMILFGLSFAIGNNVNSILEQVQMKQGMEVFIWDEVTDEQRDRFENEIKRPYIYFDFETKTDDFQNKSNKRRTKTLKTI